MHRYDYGNDSCKYFRNIIKTHFFQVGTILSMLGHQLDDKMLADIINEVDADGSGELEFEEFVQLAARFMVEEDAEVFFCAFISIPWNHFPFISSGHATRTQGSFQIIR